MKTLKLSLGVLFLAALVGGGLIVAQQFTPLVPTTTAPASTGSSINELLLLTPPASLGGACGTYNVLYFNGATGDQFGCINGTMSPIPAREWTGTASNTDAAGFITLASGAGTYTFASTYLTGQVCVASDTTAANAVKASATTTVLTLAGTSTDVIAYQCVKRT
jgi:hypothetical protein